MATTTDGEQARGLDEILADLGSVHLSLTDPGLSDSERIELRDWHAVLRKEAAAARESMPLDRDRAMRRLAEIERRIDVALASHMDPSMVGVGESGGGGIDAYMLITNNSRIDSDAGVDELRDERRRLMDRLAEPD